ncbi:hypothetical protein VNO77_41619 [Canavalia gladiata]|uniref:Uncharacterized protein n=1 Tax=Canavalia gladiata TaxID=3824 RepID=A0AAN9PQC2_CANGL
MGFEVGAMRWPAQSLTIETVHIGCSFWSCICIHGDPLPSLVSLLGGARFPLLSLCLHLASNLAISVSPLHNLALEAAEVRKSTCPSSHHSIFPALRSYSVCHGLLEEFHEQNEGASFHQQGSIVLEFPSDHRSPSTLINLPLCSYARADVFMPLIRSEENGFAWCNATKTRRLLYAKLNPYHDPIIFILPLVNVIFNPFKFCFYKIKNQLQSVLGASFYHV